LEQDQYESQLARYQKALNRLSYQIYMKQRLVVVAFEGWSACGKGEAIRRVTERIDPRSFLVFSISAPEGDEARRHYLWRFWQRLPGAGRMVIFDQSWYRRVLVDRVEGRCAEDEWRRAYREINQFERQLVDFGAILFKFWLQIDKEEQLRRFEARAGNRRHKWRMTAEDWRNREKWEIYEEAVNEMLLKTNTITTPWMVVEANSELYAHIKILRTLVDQISHQLDYDPFTPEKPAKVKKKPKNKGKK
jgi:polyphosphate kinase 2 (PPK2 family)